MVKTLAKFLGRCVRKHLTVQGTQSIPFLSLQPSQSPEMSLISTVTPHGFSPSPNWIESSDGVIVSGSNLSLQLLVEFNELCLRAMFQGSKRYH